MKKVFPLMCLLTINLAHAQILEQLSTPVVPERDALATMEIHYGGTSNNLSLGEDQVSVTAKFSREFGVIDFSFVTKGLRGGERTWTFDMPERARQGIRVSLTDDYMGADGLSARLLETSLYFFPRRVLPAVENINGVLRVTLPTGEEVDFDPSTKQILGGVMRETGPIDLTVDRSRRKFAQLAYSGEGIMIRADRRAGTPETIYKQVYNINEDIKNAIVTFKGQTCKVPKELLWDQDENRGYFFLHATDEEFYKKVLIPRCGWSNLPQ